MTTRTERQATLLAVEIADGQKLVTEIERWLAGYSRTRTAHPLVTKATAELVAEALGSLGQAATKVPTKAPGLDAPPRALKVLPDWVLRIPVWRHLYGAGRPISVVEHLELTALVIQKYGWARSGFRTRGGKRCVMAAQATLVWLGYGDYATAEEAHDHLQSALEARGIGTSYGRWNDHPGRTQQQVLGLIREAADRARRCA